MPVVPAFTQRSVRQQAGRGVLRRLRATELVIFSFAAVIAAGTLLLSLPYATRDGVPLRVVDAFFTAVSATCVTGLAVFDIGSRLSLFGQIVLLACIQVGGLGLMTLTTVFGVILGHRLGVTNRAAIESSFHHSPGAPMATLVAHVITSTLVIEAIGAAILAAHWIADGRYGSTREAVYQAVFHSISAFCNAGFSLFATNLAGFQRDWVVLLVVSSLIVLGGLGFLVGLDLRQFARAKLAVWRHGGIGENVPRPRLAVHTRIVLIVTAALLAVGTISYYLLERQGLFQGLGFGPAVLNAYFSAVTPRTAGFNSVDYGAMTGGGLLCTMVLMMIGASPGSTGGGIKTSTFGLLTAYALFRLRGSTKVHLFGRTIPQESIDRAGAVVIVSISVVILAASVLLVTETAGLAGAETQQRFVPVFFETISAFGTVGLSMGLTPSLSTAGKLVLAVVMFVGRVGPLTLALAVTARRPQPRYRYAEENLMIG
jgi:trk/ktr system potassium uptake protein